MNNDIKYNLSKEADTARAEANSQLQRALAANARAEVAEARLKEAEERWAVTLKSLGKLQCIL